VADVVDQQLQIGGIPPMQAADLQRALFGQPINIVFAFFPAVAELIQQLPP
jgi:hypothetical protein